jgi:hypothetical protein
MSVVRVQLQAALVAGQRVVHSAHVALHTKAVVEGSKSQVRQAASG